MSKNKSIKSAPRNVQTLAAKFRQSNPVSDDTPVFKEITPELIKEVFAEQFESNKKIVWYEYLFPTPEMKEESPNMEIFIRSTNAPTDKVIAHFQTLTNKLEYWQRKVSKFPCFKEKGLTLPGLVLTKAAIDDSVKEKK